MTCCIGLTIRRAYQSGTHLLVSHSRPEIGEQKVSFVEMNFYIFLIISQAVFSSCDVAFSKAIQKSQKLTQ